MKALRQIVHAFGIGLATTAARPRHALLTAFGLLVSGFTLLVLLTIPAGLNRLAGQTGLADVALVLPSRSFTEVGGAMPPDLVHLISTLTGVAHTAEGQPMIAPQFVVNTRLLRTDGTTATVIVRGVTPMFWKIVGEAMQLQSGVRPKSGLDELVAGVSAARGFVALDTGATIVMHRTQWKVSGEFAASGGFWESELWADLAALQAAYNGQGKITSVWVKLDSQTAFGRFSRALHADARLASLQVLPQRKYYTQQTKFLDVMVGMGTRAIAVALGLGAILATINALGMALAARRRQLAILRSVGFGVGSLAVALGLEVLLIAIACTGVVALIGWLAVNGHQVGSSTLSSAIQFRLRVDAGVLWRTLVYLLVLGVISSAWPIWSALRTPLSEALQNE